MNLVTLFSISNDPVMIPLEHWNNAYKNQKKLDLHISDISLSENSWLQIFSTVEQSYIASISNILVGDPSVGVDDIGVDLFTKEDLLTILLEHITSDSIQLAGNTLIHNFFRNQIKPFVDGDLLVFSVIIRPGKYKIKTNISRKVINGVLFYKPSFKNRDILISNGNNIIDDNWIFTTNHKTGPYYSGNTDGFMIEMAIRLTQTTPDEPPIEHPRETEEDALVPSAEIVYVPTLLRSTVAEPVTSSISIPSDYRVYLNAMETPFYNGMLVKNWNGFTQEVVSQRPMFFSSGGYNDGPFVYFNRTKSQFLEGGRQYFNIQSNGGYSVIAVLDMSGTIGSWERLFEFWDGTFNYPVESIGLTRNSNTTNFNTFNVQGGGNVANFQSIYTGVAQNTWNIFAYTLTHNTNYKRYNFDGNLISTTPISGSPTNKKLTNTYIGRSSFTGNAYANMRLAYFVIYDRPLSDVEMSSVIRYYTQSTVTTLPNYYLEDESKEKLRNNGFEAGPTTTTTFQYLNDTTSPIYNWSTNSAVLIRSGNSSWGSPVSFNGLYILGLQQLNAFLRQQIINLEIDKSYILRFRVRNRRTTETPILRVTWTEGSSRIILYQENLNTITSFVERKITIVPKSTRGAIEFRNMATPGDSTLFLDAISLQKEEEHIYTKYPPVALTSSTTAVSGQLYGNGTYVVTGSSSLYSKEPFMMFDNNVRLADTIWSGWHSNEGYNSTSGVPNAGRSLGGLTGDWIKIQLPHAIILRKYVIYPRFLYPRERAPQSFSLVGSNNNTSWTILDQQYGLYWTSGEGYQGEKVFHIENNNHYLYYALVFHIAGNQDSNDIRNHINLTEWRLFSGIVEPNFNLFPPGPMTAASTVISGQPYGNGTYVASSSGNHNVSVYPPYRMFSHAITLNDGWHSLGTYSYPNGNYLGGVNLAGTPGEWVRIQLPEAIVLKKYVIYSWGADEITTSHRGPSTFKIYGSNNGSIWIELDSQVNQAWSLYDNTVGNKEYYLLHNTSSYMYYTLVTNNVGFGADGTYNKAAVLINEWQLFDIEKEPIYIEYPPTGLIGNNGSVTGQTYGNGDYEIMTSSIEETSTYQGFYAFDFVTTTANYWSSGIAYNGTTGEYEGSNGIGATSGEWIKIKLPEPIILKRYVIYPRWDTPTATLNRSPRSFKLMASNNNLNWFVLENHTDLSWNIGENTQGEKIFYLDGNTASYMYYAIVVPQVGSGVETTITRERVDIGEWKMFTTSDSPVNYYNLLGDISPVFWFDPISEAQFSLEGSLIAKWYNKKNHEIFLYQLSSTNMPTYISLTETGVIDVTQGNFMDFSNPISYVGTSTLFIVTTPSTRLESYIFSNLNDTENALALVTGYNNKSFEFFDTSLRFDIDPTPFATNTSLHIIAMVFKNGFVDVYYDGNQVAENRAFTVTDEEISRLFEMQPSGLSHGFQGTFGELMYLDYVTNTTQRQRIEGYLANKFGITTLLPMGHPYHGTSYNGPNGPTDILITSQTINGGNSIGDPIGFLSTVDNDTNDVFVYSIVGGNSWDFAIVGDMLQANAVFDSSVKSLYTILIRSVDSYGLFYDKAFNITVT